MFAVVRTSNTDGRAATTFVAVLATRRTRYDASNVALKFAQDELDAYAMGGGDLESFYFGPHKDANGEVTGWVTTRRATRMSPWLEHVAFVVQGVTDVG